MSLYHPYSIFPLGDAALLIDFGNTISEEVNRKVLRLFHRLKSAPHPGITGITPAYSSLLISYDLLTLYGHELSPFDQLAQWIEGFTSETSFEEDQKRIFIPVCYNEHFGPDLSSLARRSGLSIDEVIRLHTAPVYRVYMIGFLPGFAYMAGVDEAIAAPRLDSPRQKVAPGSVGIAGRQTGIYPLETPGGWQLIGRTPVTMFRAEDEPPVLLSPGDEVEFYSITEDEFTHYQKRPA